MKCSYSRFQINVNGSFRDSASGFEMFVVCNEKLILCVGIIWHRCKSHSWIAFFLYFRFVYNILFSFNDYIKCLNDTTQTNVSHSLGDHRGLLPVRYYISIMYVEECSHRRYYIGIQYLEACFPKPSTKSRWSSGLRRQFQVLVRKGVGLNPTLDINISPVWI